MTYRRGLGALVGIVAAGVYALLLACGSASAGKLTFSNKTFRATYSAFAFNPGEVRCPVTLEGSFHSATMRKVFEALAGHVTRAVVKEEACLQGTAEFLPAGLPWHLKYGNFTGTLPAITQLGFYVVGAAFQITANMIGIPCLTTTTAATPSAAIFEIPNPETGAITRLRFNNTFTIAFAGICELAGPADLGGTGDVHVLGRVTSTITLDLI